MNRRVGVSFLIVALATSVMGQVSSAAIFGRGSRRECRPAACRPCPSLPCPIVANNDKPKPKKTRARAVHCLFIAGTADASIAPQVVRGVNAVRALFDAPGLKEKVAEKENLFGIEATPDKILEQCRALKSTKDDTIFVYYHGHGATQDGRHVLLPLLEKNEDGSPKEASLQAVERSQIIEVLRQKEHRFICFVTDSCSDKINAKLSTPKVTLETPELPVVSLMLDNTGILDINSSTFDQAQGIQERAWLTMDGGVFSQSFVELAKVRNPDNDRDGSVSWKREFLPAISKLTDEKFQELKKDHSALAADATILTQEHQTPQTFPHDERQASRAIVPNRRQVNNR